MHKTIVQMYVGNQTYKCNLLKGSKFSGLILVLAHRLEQIAQVVFSNKRKHFDGNLINTLFILSQTHVKIQANTVN